jgi:hypothetical protein
MTAAHYVPLLDFYDAGILGINAGDARTQQHPVAPILDARDQK